MKDIDRIRPILLQMKRDVSDTIEFAARAGSKARFENDPMYRKAIVMSIINLGEAAKRLPDWYKTSNRVIPWRRITEMRNAGAHGFYTIDEDIIWDIVCNYIPKLSEDLDEAVNRL